MTPKVIAHYLPQFHDVTENNLWWWEGFTEWTNVKKAQPLYDWHTQPRTPLDGKYYNILDKDTRAWQAKIAKEYGIDGFCYYHYWFKWGKLLLEKPMEQFLLDGEPNIPFCFCWGNGNWARTWEGQPEQILMLQEYGDETDWRKHFEYLLPFFQSDLYIRKEGRSVFLIHYSKHMQEVIEPMLQKWNQWAQEKGIPEFYFVEVMSSSQHIPYAPSSSAVLEFHPLHALKNNLSVRFIPMIIKHLYNRFHKWMTNRGFFINSISYQTIWEVILKRGKKRILEYWDRDIIDGGFVSWDNSPRKGKDSLIVTGSSPEMFRAYFWRQYARAVEDGVDFVFLNAWNEWAEWAYLEPDTLHTYWYLEAIRSIKDTHA